jgi:putative transposase
VLTIIALAKYVDETPALDGWEVVKRSDDVKGFKVLSRRWVVERTFGWLGRQRRLSKDYEYLPATSETIIYIAMIGLMTRRLAQKCRACSNSPCTKRAAT